MNAWVRRLASGAAGSAAALVVISVETGRASAEPAQEGGTAAPRQTPERKERVGIHPFVAAGGIVGYAVERRSCYEEGAWACPFEEKRVALGLQAAPLVEGTVMAGKSRGFRLGLGTRYLPPVALVEGGEVHFALIPEVVGDLGGGWAGSARFFNSFVLGLGSPDKRERQARVDQCRLVAPPEGAWCDENGDLGSFGLSLSLELFLHRAVGGTTVRYGVGWQALFSYNVAHSTLRSNSDPETDSLSYSTSVESGRFVALAGVEW